MSTQIINPQQFTLADFVPSSALKSIKASTVEDSVIVSISCRNVEVYNVRLFAHNGIVELFDPASVIEAHFRALSIVAENVSVSFADDSISFLVVYCIHDIPDGVVLENLMSSTSRRVHPGSVFSFNAVPSGSSASFTIQGVGLDSDGKSVTASYSTIDSQTGKDSFVFEVDHVVSAIRSASANRMVRVSAFAVSLRDSKLTCYLHNVNHVMLFRFRNRCNSFEYIDVIGDIVTKDDTSFGSAFSNGNLVTYDRHTDRTYQVTSEPVPYVEIPLFRALLESPDVAVSINGSFYDVVITERSSEDSTDPDNLPSFKFTWRFSGRRPCDFSHRSFAYIPSDSRIFSQQYSKEYA